MLKKIIAVLSIVFILSVSYASAVTFSFDGSEFGTKYSTVIRSLRQKYNIKANDDKVNSKLYFSASIGESGSKEVKPKINKLGFVSFQMTVNNDFPLSRTVSIRSQNQGKTIEVAGYPVSDVYYYFTAVALDKYGEIQLIYSEDDYVFDRGQYKFQFPRSSKGQTEAEKAYKDIKTKLSKLYGTPSGVFSYNYNSSIGSLKGLAEYSIWLGDNDTFIILHIKPQRWTELKNDKQVFVGETYASLDLYYGTKWMQTKNKELEKFIEQVKESYDSQKTYQGL